MTKSPAKTKQNASKSKKMAPKISAPLSDLPKFVQDEENGHWIIQIRDEAQLERTFGCKTLEFGEAMASGCINISGQSQNGLRDKNDALAIVGEIQPRDSIEAMLATQMAAVHIATMRHSARLASASHLQQVEVQERVLNKLARTFTAQMEALRKHRHGGQQKMTVEHVTVNEGGQAIVGNVSKGGTQE